MSKGFHSRYSLTSDKARSKATGNEGVIIAGWSLGLPEQAHQLVLTSSASELMKRQEFFLPYERHIANDKLLADLIFAKSLCVIPVYFNSLPASEKVAVIKSITTRLPVLSEGKVQEFIIQLRNFKKKVIDLFSATKESALSRLSNLKFEIDEIAENCLSDEFVQLQIYCLEFPSALKKELYFAFVVEFQPLPSSMMM